MSDTRKATGHRCDSTVHTRASRHNFDIQASWPTLAHGASCCLCGILLLPRNATPQETHRKVDPKDLDSHVHSVLPEAVRGEEPRFSVSFAQMGPGAMKAPQLLARQARLH